MRYKLEIKRQRTKNSAPFWETFYYEGGERATVAEALRELPVDWECSCLIQKCGACAMRIGGIPRLACGTFLADVVQAGSKGRRRSGNRIPLAIQAPSVKIEPLSKFPVVRDLIVDRSAIAENLARMRLWSVEAPRRDPTTQEIRYDSARCLQCGCCLEVCPNFSLDGDFFGALAAVQSYRLLDESKLPEDRAPRTGKKRFFEKHTQKLSTTGEDIADGYRRHYFAGCGKSLACHDICPIGLPVEEMLIRSNAMAVWHRK